MTSLNALGLVATSFTTGSFAPQAWRIWRTRDVSGISLLTYIILTLGLVQWLIYGLLKGDLPLVVANSVMVVLTTAITCMKIMYGKNH